MLPKRVFVTGATGFVGTAVVEELLDRGYHINALVRPGRDLGPLTDKVRLIRGDLFDADALDAGVSSADAVIHLVGIIMEDPAKNVTFERIHVNGTRCLLESLERFPSVRRYIHMSALGTRPNAVSTYHKTKHEAEQLVRAQQQLDWTIIRPSMIHGPRGEFMRMAAKWARRTAPPFLFMPYFGAGVFGTRGAGKLQPVFVEDVARAFVDALDNPKTVRQTYDLAGPDVLTWPELHRAIAQAVVHKRRPAVAIPAWYAKLLARVVPGSLLPFNRDQVVMSQEDNAAPIGKFVSDFGWTPSPFTDTLTEYAKRL